MSARALQFGIGDDVHVRVAPAQPAQEWNLVVLEVRRRAPVEERPAESSGVLARARVPGVGSPVAVVVAVVVGLPRLRRDNDRDAVDPEVLRPEHEGRIADPAARGGELDEVDAARPVAEMNVHDPPA